MTQPQGSTDQNAEDTREVHGATEDDQENSDAEMRQAKEEVKHDASEGADVNSQ